MQFAPATLAVQEQLTGFCRPIFERRDAELVERIGRQQHQRTLNIRPEHRAGLPIRRPLEDRLRIADRVAVRVQQQHFPIRALQQRVRLELPAFPPVAVDEPERMKRPEGVRVDALDSQVRHQLPLHAGEFSRQMPQLNRQPRSDVPQHTHRDVRGREVLPSADDHDAAPRRWSGKRWNRISRLIRQLPLRLDDVRPPPPPFRLFARNPPAGSLASRRHCRRQQRELVVRAEAAFGACRPVMPRMPARQPSVRLDGDAIGRVFVDRTGIKIQAVDERLFAA